MFKKAVLLDSIFGTTFIVSLILLFHILRLFIGEFSFLDPIGDAIGDVEMTDIVFSEIRDIPPADRDIVLVNIGALSRRDIAREIQIINQYGPAVIGIDSFFRNLKEDSLGDILLNRALSKIENLVLVSELKYNKVSDDYDSLRVSDPFFNLGHHGFANLKTEALTQYQFKVCRSFPIKKQIHNKEEVAFSVKMCQLFDEKKVKRFLERGNENEIINYKGNVRDFGQTKIGGRFAALDVSDVFQKKFTPNFIKGKIVLFGYMGDDFGDRSWEDKFYTPLNVKYAGRSNPDMFGVVIHANIISMILSEDYIATQGQFSSILTALTICFLTVLLFTYIYRRLPKWYDGLTKTIQLVELLLILAVNILIFHWFNYKMSITLVSIMVALAGDSLEVCYGLFKNLFIKYERKLSYKFSIWKK